MGGRSVRLQRSLTDNEALLLNKLLTKEDLRQRSTLIAYIIYGICNGNETKALANQIVEKFNFENSKNPFEATRATILRVIKDLNSGIDVAGVLKKRGKGALELEKWDDQKITNRLQKAHDELRDNFNYTNLKTIDINLISIIENRMSFQDALKLAGINPTVHLDDVDWGVEEEAKQKLTEFLRDIEYRCGRESLNYHSMYSGQSALIGTSKDAHSQYSQCRKIGCIRRVAGSAIVRRLELLFGSYSEGVKSLLSIDDEAYSTQIQRKRRSINLDEYLAVFKEYVDANPDDWTITDFAQQNPAAHHGLHNHKSELRFINLCDDDMMAAAYAQLMFESSDMTANEFTDAQLEEIIAKVKRKRTTNIQVMLEGYNFQQLFLEMLCDVGTGLRKGVDFAYEKEIDRSVCAAKHHDKICRVEFLFENLAIDTKRTFIRSNTIKNRINRYLDHVDKLLIVTLRQKFRQEQFDGKVLTVMTVFEFIETSKEYIGVDIDNRWIPIFEEYGKEASDRIEKNKVK